MLKVHEPLSWGFHKKKDKLFVLAGSSIDGRKITKKTWTMTAINLNIWVVLDGSSLSIKEYRSRFSSRILMRNRASTVFCAGGFWKSIWSLLRNDSCQFFDFFGLCSTYSQIVGCSSKSVEITLWQLNISDAQIRGLLLIINKSTMLRSQPYC